MESSHRIALLVAMGQQRWLLPVLAQMHAGQGARFVELRNRIGLPRESLVRALDMALELGWIVRNPGHGHPLRPEYLLSEGGALIADEAARLAAALKDAGIAPRARA